MMQRKLRNWLGHAGIGLSLFCPLAAIGDDKPGQNDGRIGLGRALESAFTTSSTVIRFPDNVAPGGRGIVQRSFLTLEKPTRNIQVAFVIDATLTMSRDISDLQQKLRSVVQRIQEQVTEVRSSDQVMVEVSVVVYRDIWAEYDKVGDKVTTRQSPVEVYPPKGFINFTREESQQEVLNWLAEVKTENGAPGFEEQVDRGIATAIDLPWSNSKDVTRLIFVAGDAPPWPEEYTDWKRNPDWLVDRDDVNREMPLRGFTTKKLAEGLRNKSISLFAVCCESTESGDDVTPKIAAMRQFFRDLADNTNGGVLDLKHQDTVARLTNLSSVENRQLIELRSFKDSEIQFVANVESTKPVRMAFIPWVAWKQLNFADRYSHDGYRVSSLLTKAARDINAEYCPTADEVRRACEAVAASGDDADVASVMQKLANELQVDVIVAGNITNKTDLELVADLSVYGASGELLDTKSVRSSRLSDLVRVSWDDMVGMMKDKSASNPIARRFLVSTSTKSVAKPFETTKIDEPGFRLLNDAYQTLEEAAEYALGNEKGVALSRQALGFLEELVRTNPESSVEIQILLASAHINLQNRSAAIAALEQGRKLAQTLSADDLTRLELEADYALHVQRLPVDAIEKYQAIVAGPGHAGSATKLRAQWMLSGLYLGDWDTRDIVYEKLSRVKCCDDARACIFAILKNWPSSPEAGFYRQFIQPPLPAPQSPGEKAANQPRAIVNSERSLLVPARRPPVMTASRLRRPPQESVAAD